MGSPLQPGLIEPRPRPPTTLKDKVNADLLAFVRA
jgi:hypothetical protein